MNRVTFSGFQQKQRETDRNREKQREKERAVIFLLNTRRKSGKEKHLKIIPPFF